jgi:hypothetical protein
MLVSSRLGAILTLTLACGSVAQAGTVSYYIGRDTRVGSNEGRVTFLFNHGDHFHRIGWFGGPEGRIPEAYHGSDVRLRMDQGSGLFAGRYVLTPYDRPGDVSSEYSDVRIRPFSTLAGFPSGTDEEVLFNSGGGRYQGDLGGSRLALELISRTGDIHLADAAGNSLLSNSGDLYELGDGTSFAEFTPVFMTGLGAGPGLYSMRFRLRDLNGIVPESGIFAFDFRAVPEPGSIVLFGLGAGLLGARWACRRSRRSGAPSLS